MHMYVPGSGEGGRLDPVKVGVLGGELCKDYICTAGK